MKINCLLAFLGLALHVGAQDSCAYQVTGRVLEIETGEPIPFVSVVISNTSKGAMTDETGRFQIQQICQKEFDLVVSHVGYKSAVHHHDIYHAAPVILLAPDNRLLHSVVVEGEYNPASLQTLQVASLSGEKLDLNRSGTFGELAGTLAGVSVLNTGQNIAKPIIHGLHSNRVLIINNGVRHEFQNWGAEHAPEIDPSQAGSIDVIKGAATVRYGPDALGGVLLVNPPVTELSSGLEASATLLGRSNGRAGEGSLSVGHGWRQWAVAAQASWLGQGHLHAPDYQLTNTGRQEQSYSGSFRYHRSHFDLEGYASRFRQNLGILRASVNGSLDDLAYAMQSEVPPGTQPFSYTIRNPRQAVVHDLIKLKSTYIQDHQSFSVQYAYQHNERQEYDIRRGTNNELPSIDLKLSSHTLDADWSHPAVSRWTGMVGMQALYQANRNVPGTNTIQFVPNYRNTRVGIFLIETRELAAGSVEAGVRYDFQYLSLIGRSSANEVFSNDLLFSQATGTVGYNREWGHGYRFRSNIGTAWRAPTVSELYSFGRHQSVFEYGLWRYAFDENGQITTARVLTEEEREVKPEAGLKWIHTLTQEQTGWRWEATAYTNWIRHFIYTRPAGITNTVRGAFPYFIYDQDDAFLWGLDLVAERTLATSWHLEAQASYVNAQNLSRKESFVGIPPARTELLLRYTRKPDWLTRSVLGLGAAYTFRYWQAPRVITVADLQQAVADGQNLFGVGAATFDFQAAPAGFPLARAYWTGAKGAWQWTLSVRNALNTRYRSYTDRLRYFADQTGRDFQLSITYHFH